MTRSILASTVGIISTAILCFHPMPNQTVHAIAYIASLLLYAIMMGVAYDKEQQLKSRIEALEEKLRDKEQSK